MAPHGRFHTDLGCSFITLGLQFSLIVQLLWHAFNVSFAMFAVLSAPIRGSFSSLDMNSEFDFAIAMLLSSRNFVTCAYFGWLIETSSVLQSDLVRCASVCEVNSLEMSVLANPCTPTAIHGAMFCLMHRILDAGGPFTDDCRSSEDEENSLVSKV